MAKAFVSMTQRMAHGCAVALMAVVLWTASLWPAVASAQSGFTLSPDTLPNASTQAYYFQTLNASGGVTPYTYRVSAGALPPGIFLFSSFLSGTPIAAGSYAFSITATDRTSPVPLVATRDYVLVVEQTPFTIDAAVPPVATAGRSYGYSIVGRGGIKPYTFRIDSGALPTGLTLGSDGSISGVPMAAGTFDITVAGTDSASGTPSTVSRSFRLVVERPVVNVSPERPPSAALGAPFVMSFTASGGKAPYVYALTAGTLPPGLQLSPSGTITGIPEAMGSYTITVGATDSSTGYGPVGGSHAYTLVVEPPRLKLETAVLPPARGGQTYSVQLVVSNGVAPYEFVLASGALPPGLVLGEDGTITGRSPHLGPPYAFVPYGFFVNVVDANRRSATFGMDITVIDTAMQIGPSAIPNGVVGVTDYQVPFTAGNATAPYTFALQSGGLPQGMHFDPATAALSGIPLEPGDFSFTLQLTDAENRIAAREYVFTIAEPTVSLTPTTLSVGTAGVAYRESFSASGGAAPYRFKVIQGELPSGLTVSPDGVISGTTDQAGSFSFIVEAASFAQVRGTHAFNLQIDPLAGLDLSPSAMPQGTAGIRYVQPVAPIGGVAPYTVTLSGRLPTGLAFDPATGIDGIPLEAGTFAFDIAVSDAGGATFSRTYSMVIAPPPLVLYPGLPDATLGVAYSLSIGHNGGLGPFRHVISAGSLPAGMSLSESGVLSGTPTVAGQFPFEITITDSTLGIPGTGTQAYVLIVADPDIAILPAVLPVAIYRAPYSVALSMSGSTGPYQFSLVGGELPPGLTLTSAGLLSGTPTNPFPYEFTIQGISANGALARRTFQMKIPVTAVTSSSPPAGVAGVPYAHTVQISGGTAPYTVGFKVKGGRFGMELVPGLQLPPGLVITPTPNGNAEIVTGGQFTITGTPTWTGDYPVYLQVEDSTAGAPATESVLLTLRILPPHLAVTPTTLPNASVGVPYRHVLTVQGGVAPYRFALTPGSRPPDGLTLSADGVLSGTPSMLRAQQSFSVDVTDSTQPIAGTVTTVLTLDIGIPVVVAPSRTVNTMAGVDAVVELTEGATGGPFTAASVLSLSPGNAGNVRLEQVGTGTNARFVLTFSPAAGFSGVATLRYSLSSGTVVSAEATIEITVVPRPDPSHDPEVLGLLDAQARSARSFATAQIGNVRQRLESLHGAGTGRYPLSNSLTFAASSTAGRCVSRVGAPADSACAAPVPEDDVVIFSRHRREFMFGTWVAGTVRSGDRDARGDRPSLDVETEGVSAGGDMRIGGGYAGVGIGYGRDRTWVGDDDTRSDAHAYTLSAYGGYAPGDVFFVDGVLGYQSLRYDLRRSLTATAGEMSGRRDGRQWFAALTAGADLEHCNWLFMPYGRLEFVRATLDGYREQGDPIYALHYDDQTLRSGSANLGLRADYRRRTGWGLFAPQLRVEYQQDVEGDRSATLRYADWAQGPAYRADVRGYGRRRWEVGLGALFENHSDWRFTLGYRAVFDDYGRDQGLSFDIQHPF